MGGDVGSKRTRWWRCHPLIFTLFAARASFAADIYLRVPDDCANDGDGTQHDCATESGGPGAFNRWSSAFAQLRPGDTVWLDGTWSLSQILFFQASGTMDAPIRITSYSPEEQGGSALIDGPIYFEADYLEIDHLGFRNSAGTCVLLGVNGGRTQHQLRFHDNRLLECDNGISIRDVEGTEVYDNALDGIGSRINNQGHCIYVAQGTNGARVYRNRCSAKPDIFASHCLHVYHAEFPGPARDVEFHDNVCLGFSAGAGVYSGSQGVRIYGNTFVAARGAGTAIAGLVCRYGGSDAAFVNNIVVGAEGYLAFIEDAASCELNLDYNLYFEAHGDGRFYLDGLRSPSEWTAVYDLDSVFDDPLLADIQSGDVHLLAASPARDRGDNDFAADLDFYRAARIVGDVIDIGAAEYQDPCASWGVKLAPGERR